MKTKKTPAAPVQAEERKPGKRYRGSAVLSHEGDFIFTPYNEGVRENPWRVICANSHALLRETDEVIQLRVTLPKSNKRTYRREMLTIAAETLIYLK